MKRRSLLKSLTTASLGAPLLGCSNLNPIKKTTLKNIKHNPIGVSTYSFWQFNGRETPIEYCIDKASEFGFDGIELLLIQMESE
ncbi:sugar phosphate isomerase/epimerase, partial [Flavobacteriaceae bacterium]|nr:sugar phosphate isomerase/epimerase [Flavobacteriaceae bacterium]